MAHWVTGKVTGVSVLVGTAVGQAVVSTEVGTAFFEMMANFAYEEGASGGMGAGWGFTIQCDGNVLFSFGGGAGATNGVWCLSVLWGLPAGGGPLSAVAHRTTLQEAE